VRELLQVSLGELIEKRSERLHAFRVVCFSLDGADGWWPLVRRSAWAQFSQPPGGRVLFEVRHACSLWVLGAGSSSNLRTVLFSNLDNGIGDEEPEAERLHGVEQSAVPSLTAFPVHE